LNPSGIRFGSAEIYNAIEKFSEFDDTICIGQRRPSDSDEAVILFVKMKPQTPTKRLNLELISSIKNTIIKALSARHVPKYIFEVPDIPYTINGKKIELAVKQIVSGVDITPSGAVANPECLPYFKRFIEVEKMAQAGLAAKL
jgi:acetoacetyl-CoA synthetase